MSSIGNHPFFKDVCTQFSPSLANKRLQFSPKATSKSTQYKSVPNLSNIICESIDIQPEVIENKSAENKTLSSFAIDTPKFEKNTQTDQSILTKNDSSKMVKEEAFMKNIPQCTSNPDHLDQFLNICKYFEKRCDTPDLKTSLLEVIKIKLSTEVLQKIGTIDDYNTWEELKTVLRNKIKPLVTSSTAEAAIRHEKQKADENVSTFGARIKSLLQAYNNTPDIVDLNDSNKFEIRKRNEKYAINRFQQGLFNPELKRIFLNVNSNSLDEAIACAREKELWIKDVDDLVTCSICKSAQHLEFECTDEKKKLAPNTDKTEVDNKNGKNGAKNDNKNGEKNKEDPNAQKQNFCVRCKKNGHDSSVCYSRFPARSNQNSNFRPNNTFFNRNNSSGFRNPSQSQFSNYYSNQPRYGFNSYNNFNRNPNNYGNFNYTRQSNQGQSNYGHSNAYNPSNYQGQQNNQNYSSNQNNSRYTQQNTKTNANRNNVNNIHSDSSKNENIQGQQQDGLALQFLTQ